MATKKKKALVATLTDTFGIGDETIALVKDEELPDMSDNALEILTANGHVREVDESEMEEVDA